MANASHDCSLETSFIACLLYAVPHRGELFPVCFRSMQNVVPVLDGPAEVTANPEQQLQEQEKRIEISCALAAEASRRSRLLSGEEACRPEEPGRAVTPAV